MDCYFNVQCFIITIAYYDMIIIMSLKASTLRKAESVWLEKWRRKTICFPHPLLSEASLKRNNSLCFFYNLLLPIPFDSAFITVNWCNRMNRSLDCDWYIGFFFKWYKVDWQRSMLKIASNQQLSSRLSVGSQKRNSYKLVTNEWNNDTKLKIGCTHALLHA